MNRTLIMDFSTRVLLASVVLLLSILLGWLLSIMIRRVGRIKSVRQNRVYRLIAGSLNTVIIGAGAVSALGTLGVNVTVLVAGLGLTGFAVGMALKDAISNLVAGLMIIVYAPFDLEDTIEVTGTEGKVVDINLTYVTLQTDSELVLIPNSNFVTSVIRKRSGGLDRDELAAQ